MPFFFLGEGGGGGGEEGGGVMTHCWALNHETSTPRPAALGVRGLEASEKKGFRCL